MKFIKKYESIKGDIENWSDLDDQSYMTFDDFYKKVQSISYLTVGEIESSLSGPNEQNVPDHYIITKKKSRFDNNTSYHPEYEEWKKRNSVITASVETGGASGGSCWDTGDDPGAEPYDTGNTLYSEEFCDKVLREWITIILSSSPNMLTIDEIITDLKSSYLVKEDTNSNYEYYGNYTNYQYCEIKLIDLWRFLSEKDCL